MTVVSMKRLRGCRSQMRRPGFPSPAAHFPRLSNSPPQLSLISFPLLLGRSRSLHAAKTVSFRVYQIARHAHSPPKKRRQGSRKQPIPAVGT